MDSPSPVRILAVSGSLRRMSSNRALVTAAARVAPAHMHVIVFDALAAIPAFNPDLDAGEPPQPVAQWRDTLSRADAVIISSPEYAHGVPGVLKNALDWIVGSGELIDKPVAVIDASAHATFARRSLIETLTVMSARVLADASVTVPVQGKGLDAEGIAADATLSGLLARALQVLAAATRPAAV